MLNYFNLKLILTTLLAESSYTHFEILSIVCSILGAMFFIYGLKMENEIINMLKKIRKPKDWRIQQFLTAFFLLGYVLNILSIFLHWEEVQLFMTSLVFLFGAIFLISIVAISKKTYKAIFDAAENDLDTEIELSPQS